MLDEFAAKPARSLKPALLATALVLILLDGLCAAALAGRLMALPLRSIQRRPHYSSVIFIAMIVMTSWFTKQALAQESEDAFALQAGALHERLVVGDEEQLLREANEGVEQLVLGLADRRSVVKLTDDATALLGTCEELVDERVDSLVQTSALEATHERAS